jgi:glycosyltransferase 2 family protein
VKKALSVFNYLLFLLLGGLFLWLVFRDLDANEIISQIVHANYWWISGSIASGILAHVVRAARWNILIGSMGYQTRLSTTFYAVMTGYLSNVAIPRLGEVTRCGVLSKKQGIPFTTLLGTVIAERVFDMFIMLMIILLVILFQLNLVGSFVDKHVFSPLFMNFESNLLPILLILAIIAMFFISAWFIWRVYRQRLEHLMFFRRLSSFAGGLSDGIKTIKRTRNKGMFLVYTLLIWFLYSLMIYLPFFAMHDTSHLDFGDAITVMSIGSLGIVAPVPGGIGTYHFIVKATLVELYDIEQATAASFATITHAAQSLMIICVGGLSFLMLFLQKNHKNHGIS